MRHVFVLPPSESCSSLVSRDSRYGMYPLMFFFLKDWALFITNFELLDRFDSPDITLPRVDNDRLIVLSSNKCFAPISSSLSIFSDPARSHKLSFAFCNIPLLSTVSVSTSSWNIEWDLELFILILVCLVTLFFSPRFSNA